MLNRTGAYTRLQQRRAARRSQRVAAIHTARVRAYATVIPAGASVLDIGAGCGIEVAALKAAGYEAAGIDGTLKINRYSQGLVTQCNLTSRQETFKYYGAAAWGLCIEVGEHIPQEYESVFLDNLAQIPRNGLILSWAGHGQPGSGHVNCRTQVYIAGEMVRRGWDIDDAATAVLRDALPRHRHLSDTRIMVLTR